MERSLLSVSFTGGIETYFNASGTLISPWYPKYYPPGLECTYIISQPKESVVNLTILFMDIDCQETGTTSDYLEVRDGKFDNSPVMGRICGTGSSVPASIQTTQNYMRIMYVKDT